MAVVLGHRDFFLLEPVPFVEVQNGRRTEKYILILGSESGV